MVIFFVVLEFELRAYNLSHSTSPFFCEGFFRDRVMQSICPSSLRTAILLISAFLVARNTGMSHWDLAHGNFFKSIFH
jgi:hypothetical protein